MTPVAPLSSGRLTHLGILRFSGADALSFLQGQISNDTRRLAEGFPLFAAYSSPQGRVLALIYLIPHSSGVLALLPRELVAPTLERMRKFVLRAKVKVEDAADAAAGALLVAGVRDTASMPTTVASLTASVTAAGLNLPRAAQGYVETDGVGVARVGHDSRRFWVVGTAEQLAARDIPSGGTDTTATFEREWRLADIQAGLPQVYGATAEAFVAQMLNLDLLDGISFTKGCYTGQEIIARTQHLGRIKRRMAALQLPTGVWSVGQQLRLTDGRSGRLTEVVTADGSSYALAVLTLPAAASADGTAATGSDASLEGSSEIAATQAVNATEMPLPYPLSR